LDHYKNAPLLLRKRIEILLAKLEVAIARESKVAFAHIISQHPNLDIYAIGLFYHAESWDFVVPTFSSEQGLQYVAENYASDSIKKLNTIKTALRWSTCDSPHHDNEAFLHMMPVTKILLKEMSHTLDIADPMYHQYQWPKHYADNYTLFYQFLTHVYQSIQNTVRLGLREVWKSPSLRHYFVTQHCAVTLSCDGITHEAFLQHLRRLNTEATYYQLKQELTQVDLVNQQVRDAQDFLINEDWRGS